MMAGDGHVDGRRPDPAGGRRGVRRVRVMCHRAHRGAPREPVGRPHLDPHPGLRRRRPRQGAQGDPGRRATSTGPRWPSRRTGSRTTSCFAFLAVLLVAGNETTRNALTGGLVALSKFPEQRKLHARQPLRRRVHGPGRRRAHPLRLAGDRLHPHRHPRPHLPQHRPQGGRPRADALRVGQPRRAGVHASRRARLHPRDRTRTWRFGIGPHFCLGANLARMEIKIVFQELFSRLPDIAVPEGTVPGRSESSLVIGLEDVPATFTACPVAH